MTSLNKLLAFNRSRKIISLSEEYFQDSIILNCNANNISLSDRKFKEFSCIHIAVQSHILSDDGLYSMFCFWIVIHRAYLRGRKVHIVFCITELSCVSTVWSKTIIHIKAICGWSSLLNYFASSSGVQLLQRRFGWAVHYALKSKLGDTHTSVDMLFTSQAISNMKLETFCFCWWDVFFSRGRGQQWCFLLTLSAHTCESFLRLTWSVREFTCVIWFLQQRQNTRNRHGWTHTIILSGLWRKHMLLHCSVLLCVGGTVCKGCITLGLVSAWRLQTSHILMACMLHVMALHALTPSMAVIVDCPPNLVSHDPPTSMWACHNTVARCQLWSCVHLTTTCHSMCHRTPCQSLSWTWHASFVRVFIVMSVKL